MAAPDPAPGVAIELSAVVAAVRGAEAVALTVRSERGGEAALPSGAFDPRGDRTFELAVRRFAAEQTGFELGYVEQLYTFGDAGRDTPTADVGGSEAGGRVVSVGYLALTAAAAEAAGARWTLFTHFFPWEDHRRGRPAALDALEPALRAWAGAEGPRLDRLRALWGLDGRRWNEERVLERYELLYEAGLAPEAARDRGAAGPADPAAGPPMASDHRRILATGLGRLRGKLKYRPVAFDLLGREFTLSALQRTVEAVAGVSVHKQNFRRGVERTGLVEGVGRLDAGTGGRPAELHRFRRDLAAAGPALGLPLPLLREADGREG